MAGAEEALAKLHRLRSQRAPNTLKELLASSSSAVDFDALDEATALKPEEAYLSPWLQAMERIINLPCEGAHEPELPVSIQVNDWGAVLMLGDTASASDLARLQELGVTHVYNAAGSAHSARAELGVSCYEGAGIAYMEVDAEEALTYDMTQHVAAACDFFRAAEVNGGMSLVHGKAGSNRSGLLALAHVMLSGRVPLLKALQRCKDARGVFLYNRAFQLQALRLASCHMLLGPQPEEED